MIDILAPYKYGTGYISLPVDVSPLPDTLAIPEASGMLLRKPKFHVSLICVKCILEKFPEDQQTEVEEVLRIFNDYVERKPVIFQGFKNEFRFARRDGKESVIVMCDTSDLSGLFTTLSEKMGFDIPTPPTHVTLYSLQENVGIGIRNERELDETQVLSGEEIAHLWRALHP